MSQYIFVVSTVSVLGEGAVVTGTTVVTPGALETVSKLSLL